MTASRTHLCLLALALGLLSTVQCQKQFSCNGQLYYYLHCACTYPGYSNQYSCNGQLSQAPNTLCSYTGAPVNGICTGIPSSQTTAQYSCNGALTPTFNSLCSYPNPPVNGIYTGIPLNNGGTQQYQCNGLIQTNAIPACTYPSPAVNGVFQGVSVPTCNGVPATSTAGPLYFCNGILCSTPNAACFPAGTLRFLCGNVYYNFQCTNQACYACQGVCSTTMNSACTYPSGK